MRRHMYYFGRATTEAKAKICKALGIDPSVTKSVTIELDSESFSIMGVAQYLTPEQAEKLDGAIVTLDMIQSAHDMATVQGED